MWQSMDNVDKFDFANFDERASGDVMVAVITALS